LAEWIRYSAFGEKTILGNQQGLFNPWRFANRREIADLSLFTHRFYNPSIMRWHTTDPLGFKEGLNLYAYVRNNPFYYKDPDGRVVFLLLPVLAGTFGTGGIVITGSTVGAIAGTVAGTALAWGVYKACKWVDNAYNQVEVEEQGEKEKKKSTSVYAPDRPLPRDKYGNPIPDTEGKHTQLGTKESKKTGEKYPQAREFDVNGKPVRDLDFSDHGYPQTHPNPHQHKYIENETGGTPNRSRNAEPLDYWNYY
jgi:RHS repeat-associated protein